MSDSKSFDGLKAKLEILEGHLQQLMESTQDDLQIARALQKLLMPNRLPEIQGLHCLARYISSQDLCAESFDIVSAENHREVWIITSWTSSFGLSSVLLQGLLHLKTQGLFQGQPGARSPSEIFDEITQTLAEAQKKASYRLNVVRLDMNSLHLSGCSVGSPPLLQRAREKNLFTSWTYIQPEALLRNPGLMERAQSQQPLPSAQAHRWEHTLSPGSRFYFLGREWNPSADLATWLNPLHLGKPAPDTALLDDLNHLLVRAESHLRAQNRRSDLTALAFELDSRVLHLA